MLLSPAHKSRRRFLLFLSGIVCLILFVFLIDRALAIYLNKTDYFTAMTADSFHIMDTKEFSTSFRISSQGLRNRNVVMPKPKGTYRILAVGDSFTYGWGVSEEEKWTTLLEKKYQETGQKVEIINAGIPGYDLGAYIHACQSYKSRFDIDSVIVGFYSYEDLDQLAAIEANKNQLTKFLEKTFPTLIRLRQPLIGPLFEQNSNESKNINVSTSWKKWINVIIAQYPAILKKIEPAVKMDLLEGKINANLVAIAAADPDYWLRALNDRDLEYIKRLFYKELNRLKKNCAYNNPLYFLMIPSMETVSKDYFPGRSGLGYNIDDRLLTIDLDGLLKTPVTETGFIYLSLLPDFRSDGCPNCYYLWDSHLTSTGHIRGADYLYRELPKKF